MNIADRLQHIQERINQACTRSGRNRDDIHIVAVTKYVDTLIIEEVLQAGLHHIGENKAQDIMHKWEQLSEPKGTWHFVGHLQSNKVKYMIDKCTYIHSLDRLSLAKQINKLAQAQHKIIPCFVQVNISGESSKHGLSPVELPSFIEALGSFDYIQVIGLMTMAPHELEAEQTRPVFHELKVWQEKLQQENWSHAPLSELSMGMSNDFEIAVEEGATFLRLGSALVG